MNKTRNLTIILLFLILLVLISINFTEYFHKKIPPLNQEDFTYKIEYNNTVVYSSEGVLNYRIISQYAEYFPEEKISYFTQPTLITYKNKIAIWSIKSDYAKLINNHTLYLYGHVKIGSLITNSQIRKITANNTKINLITQDIISYGLTTLYGKTFNSKGLQMRGNLKNKRTELIGKVITFYEIKNKQT